MPCIRAGFVCAAAFRRNVGEGRFEVKVKSEEVSARCRIPDAPADGAHPLAFPWGKVPPKGADEGRGALKHSFACSAKRDCSPTLISLLRFAPQPASPRGSQGGSGKSALPRKNDVAYQREGQAPPLRYDEGSRVRRAGRCGHRPLQTFSALHCRQTTKTKGYAPKVHTPLLGRSRDCRWFRRAVLRAALDDPVPSRTVRVRGISDSRRRRTR